MKKLLIILLLCASAFAQSTAFKKQTSFGKQTWFGGAAGGAQSVVLEANADSAFASTLVLTTSTGIPSGNGVVVLCIAPSTYTSTLTFTDSAGNTGYQEDLTFTGTGYTDFQNYYSDYVTTSIAASGSVTVHLSNGLSEDWHCWLFSIRPMLSSAWFDQSSTNSNAFGATQNPGTTAATANAKDACIPSFVGQSSGWGTLTWNSGYTQASAGTILSAGRYAGTGYKTLSAPGTQTMSLSITTSDNSNGAMACYKQQ